MNEKTGTVFSLARDNAPVPECTVSKAEWGGRNPLTVFSLARDTDISAEIYPYRKLLFPVQGSLTVYGPVFGKKPLQAGSVLVTPADTPVGVCSQEGAVYLELASERTDLMNSAIKAGEAFRLAETVPYQEGKIVNMDIVHNDTMKFVVMAFDKGTGLSEHAAPGEAMIFALDGEGIIGYEGKEHVLRAGENFCFAKGGLHFVRAEQRFKMALLLTLA